MTRTVILDNEPVQALMSVRHPKHSRALAHMQVVASRKKKGVRLQVVVPTAVRVEAGWDRTAPGAAFINLLRIADAALDTATANRAATLRSAHAVSVADAHVGAVITASAEVGPVTVLSSEPDDMRTVAGAAEVVVVAM